MTFPKHFTHEQIKEANRLKSLKYRAEHKDIVRGYDKKRYPARQKNRRLETYKGKRCEVCDILLVSNYGGHGTKKYCDDHKNEAHKMYMRKYRLMKKTGKPIVERKIVDIPSVYFKEILQKKVPEMRAYSRFLNGTLNGNHLIKNDYCGACDTDKEHCIYSKSKV